MNVLSEEKKQQAIALGRLGWSLRRIQCATRIRRETAAGYLKTSVTYAKYALGHVKTLLGDRLVVEITPEVVKRYQTARLREKAGPKTINDEVMLLLRLCGDRGDLIRATLRRSKSLKLPLPPSPGRPYSAAEKSRRGSRELRAASTNTRLPR